MSESAITGNPIETVEDLLARMREIAAAHPLQDIWWRGQSRFDWKVLPKLYRPHTNYPRRYEWNSIIEFRNQSRTRHHCHPPTDDLAGWLFLAQHYGLPTRILDWSTSTMTALYFAVEHNEKYDTEEGCLVALLPALLNKSERSGRDGEPQDAVLLAAEDIEVKKLVAPAFYHDRRDYPKILAVLPNQMDVRHLVQQAVCTVHGRQSPLEDAPGSESYLFRMRVPASAKAEIRKCLGLLGVRRSTLFPDLSNLAADIVMKEYYSDDGT